MWTSRILVNADIDKRSKVRHIRDNSLEHHVGLHVRSGYVLLLAGNLRAQQIYHAVGRGRGLRQLSPEWQSSSSV